MENNNYIPFKKRRELGDIINVTFKFIRENYKPLFHVITKTVGPFFLLLVLALSYYSYMGGSDPLLALNSSTGSFIIAVFVLVASLLLFYASFYGTILHYIKLYVENQGIVDGEEVKQGVREDFLKLVLLSILSAILIIAGFLLFVLPGIYLMVPLSLAGAVLVFKRYSVTEALAYCFDLVKNHWWMTFLTLLVIWLLVYVIGLVFQMPLIIYTVVKTLLTVQEGSAADPEAIVDWVFIVLNVFSSVIQYLLSAITIISLAFIYYNLNEHKNLTGTYETIDNLGK